MFCRNNLLRLRLSNLRLLEQVQWTSDNVTVSMCIAKGQPPVSYSSNLTPALVLDCTHYFRTAAQLLNLQVAQLSQRDRAAGWVSNGQKVEDWNWETIFTGSIGLYSTTVTYLASKAIEFGEKTRNKGHYAVQGLRGRYQSKARRPVRLPISDNWTFFARCYD